MYRFIGSFELIYPAIVIPGRGVLVAQPGDEIDFQGIKPPADGRWVPAEPPKAAKIPAPAKES